MKIGGMALAALVFLAQPAFAAYTVLIYENGGNVVAEGSGSVNTSALTLLGPTSDYSYIYNSLGHACIGTGTMGSPVPTTWYMGGTALAAFGPSSAPQHIADTGSGSQVCIAGIGGQLGLPSGYTSGESLGNSTAVWQGATLSSLQLTPGTYQSSWGQDDTADSFTLVIRAPAPPAVPAVTAVPTLSEWGLILLAAMAGALGLRARRRS